jgi:FtsP/CotA-like multicopper oxidase with cupredoxin domain
VNHSRRGEAGGSGTLAPAALLGATADKVIKEVRSTPKPNRREAGAAIVGPSYPDPPLTAAAMRHRTHPTASTRDAFPRHVVAGLPHALPPIAVPLRDGDTLPLWIGSVQKQIAGRPIRMLAYNGSIPGPLLRVAQGSDITVAVTNNAGFEQTVHWHGLRVDNRSDGVPSQTQQRIPVLGVVTYRLQFPDPGPYWYHPHLREDDGRQIGPYGQIIVDPADPGYRPRLNREIPLTLDDLIVQAGFTITSRGDCRLC